jgi:hypothetical protein
MPGSALSRHSTFIPVHGSRGSASQARHRAESRTTGFGVFPPLGAPGGHRRDLAAVGKRRRSRAASSGAVVPQPYGEGPYPTYNASDRASVGTTKVTGSNDVPAS